MRELKNKCHNEARLFKAKSKVLRSSLERRMDGYLVRLLHCVRNDRVRGAMFGLEAGALRKQSGGLFLAKLRRLTFRLVEGQQASGNKFGITLKQLSYKAKFGAMFGLDARIALAIFGALSVISGAALYSAIKSAQTERYWQEFREMIKATEQYYLDNGKNIPVYSTANLYTGDLVENRENLSTWKGPYIAGIKNGNASLTNSLTKEFMATAKFNILFYESSTWTTDYDACVVNSTDCSQWIALYSGASTASSNKLKSLFADLDEKIDNKDGVKAGNVRMFDGTTYVRLFVKGMRYIAI